MIPAEKLRSLRIPLAIFAAGVLLFGANLGERDFWEPDEGDFAEIAREMGERGDWIVPHLNGKPYSEKPPLYYWTLTFSRSVFGEPEEFSFRLPSVLAGAGGLVIVFLWGRRLFGDRVGLAAAAILATSFRYLWNAAYLQTDMLFSFFVLLSLYLFWRLQEIEAPSFWKHALPFYLSLAAATLTKGPLAEVLAFLPILAFALWSQRRDLSRKSFWVRGLTLTAALTLWWYLAAALEAGEGFLHGAIVREHLMRFFDSDSHNQPPYYYLLHFWAQAAPWAIFAPLAFADAWRRRGEPGMRFLLCCFGTGLLFLSISSSKQGKYLLPPLPVFALLVSAHLDRIAEFRWGKVSAALLDGISALFVALGFVAGALLFTGWLPEFAQERLASEEISPDLLSRLLLVPIALAPFGALSLRYRRRRQLPRCGWIAGGIAAAFSIFAFLYRDLNQLKSARPLMERTAARLVSGGELAVYGSFRGSYAYYSRRGVREIKGEGAFLELKSLLSSSRPVYCLVRKDQFESSLKDQLDLPYSVVDQSRIGGRRMVVLSNR